MAEKKLGLGSPLGSSLLDEKRLEEDSFGLTYFKTFYGIDRAWLLVFLFSAVCTPLVREFDIFLEGSHRKHDFMFYSDMMVCGVGMLLLLAIARAVDTTVFISMHVQYGRKPHHLWPQVIKVLAVINTFRPLAPAITGDSADAPISHVGGIFEASVGVAILPFGIGVYVMCMKAADNVLQEIRDSPDTGKWVRVLKLLQSLRSDMIGLWSIASVGLPWCLFIAGALWAAYINAVLFLSEKDSHRAFFFFAYLALILTVLLPLSFITNACSRTIKRATEKWFPPDDVGPGMPLATEEFQAYTVVMHFLDGNFIGVGILGFPITSSLLRDNALKAFVGLPGLYFSFIQAYWN